MPKTLHTLPLLPPLHTTHFRLPPFPLPSFHPSTLSSSPLPSYPGPILIILIILVPLPTFQPSNFNLLPVFIYVTIKYKLLSELLLVYVKRCLQCYFTEYPEMNIISEKNRFFQVYFNKARISYHLGI